MEILSLADAGSLNAELRAHVVSLEVAEQRALADTRFPDFPDCGEPVQMADLLPFVFDDDVRVLSAYRDNDYQGEASVTYEFRGATFRIELCFGSCECCVEWTPLSEYETTMFERIIPFIRFESKPIEENAGAIA